MHLIVYTSRSLLQNDEFDGELNRIIATSQRNNSANGLTGVMFQHRNRFLQFLEGEQPAVRKTFDRIKSDPRHSDIEVLFDSPIRQRGCPGWSMDSFDIPRQVDMDSEHLKMLSENYCKNFIVQTDTILALFKGFISESKGFSSL